MTVMPRRGLYAITDLAANGGERLLPAVRAAVKGGAVLIQYRDKSTDRARRLREVRMLLDFCKTAGVPLLVNDDVPLAAETGADGVHLGRDDDDLRSARVMLGAQAIIGVSCYNDASRAVSAEQAGADYVAFGRFFASASKPEAQPARIETLRTARGLVHVPIVAIGGITAGNGAMLLEAGADLLAVIGATLGQPDPAAAASSFKPLFAAVPRDEETA